MRSCFRGRRKFSESRGKVPTMVFSVLKLVSVISALTTVVIMVALMTVVILEIATVAKLTCNQSVASEDAQV